MWCRFLLSATICMLPAFAAAQTVQDSIISQLQNQGFTQIEVSRTLLGRVILHATSSQLERELVFNPTTGEILRDYWVAVNTASRTAPLVLMPETRQTKDTRSTASAAESENGGNVSFSDNSGSSAGDRDKEDSSGRGSDRDDNDNDRDDNDNDRDDNDDNDDNDDDRDDNDDDNSGKGSD
jgi:hypothetical protein